MYQELCATCHGSDGRGSWRAALFLLRPGNLAGPEVKRDSGQYLFEIIKNGGAPIGRPGMPAFGSQLSEADIHALVNYIRTLGRPELGELLNADQDERVALLPDGQPHPITGHERGGVQLGGVNKDRHQLHGPHAEPGDRVVPHQQEIGGGTRHHGATHLVGRRPDDRAPQADGQTTDENREQRDEQPSRPDVSDWGLPPSRTSRDPAPWAAGRDPSAPTCLRSPRGRNRRPCDNRCRR